MPGLTVNGLLVPVRVVVIVSVAVMMSFVVALVMVTEPVHMPLVKAPVVVVPGAVV